jgi:hypothetical protein
LEGSIRQADLRIYRFDDIDKERLNACVAGIQGGEDLLDDPVFPTGADPRLYEKVLKIEKRF